MVSSRWEHVFALFDAALATSGVKRDEFLARECRDNAQLRDEVESLLAAHYDADGFLSADVASPRPQSRRPSSPPAGTLTAGTRVGVFAIERFAGSGGRTFSATRRSSRVSRAQ
jgi:eukaryotic-like serine/threonine-protein kinase